MKTVNDFKKLFGVDCVVVFGETRPAGDNTTGLAGGLIGYAYENNYRVAIVFNHNPRWNPCYLRETGLKAERVTRWTDWQTVWVVSGPHDADWSYFLAEAARYGATIEDGQQQDA